MHEGFNKMNLITFIIIFPFFSVVAPDTTGTNSNDGCFNKCDMIKEIQILRQLVNQETLFRIEYQKQLQDMKKDVAELQNKTSLHSLDAEVEVSNIRADVQASLKRIGNLEADVSKQNVKLRNQSNSVGNLEKKIQTQDSLSSAIAFHAYSARLTNGKITFSSTLLNIGGGYNTSTGEFRAPESGLYLFIWTIVINNKQNCDTALYVNNTQRRMNLVQGGTADEDLSGTQSIITSLSLGDRVTIREDKTSGYSCTGLLGSYSAISGHKL